MHAAGFSGHRRLLACSGLSHDLCRRKRRNFKLFHHSWRCCNSGLVSSAERLPVRKAQFNFWDKKLEAYLTAEVGTICHLSSFRQLYYL